MVKLIGQVVDAVLNLPWFKGYRHQILRWLGIGVSMYQVLATAEWSPLVSLPDLSPELMAAVLAYLATQGIAFGKQHSQG